MNERHDTLPFVNTFRRRVGLFLLCVAILALCAGYVLWVLVSSEDGGPDVWMAELRARGELFTIAELFPEGFGNASTNRSADLYRLIDALDEMPLQFGGQSKRDLAAGLARPFWQEANPYNLDTSSTNDWADLYLSVDKDATTLAEIYRLLPVPDRDLGVELSFGGNVRPDFVRKRSLAHQLSSVISIELNRGNPRAAAAAMEGLIQLSHWHSQHSDRVNCMFGIAVYSLVIDSQWALLQYPDWSEAQLLAWQRAWQTNQALPSLELTAQVDRAFSLQAFEMVRTNKVDWRTIIGPGSSPRAFLNEAFWMKFLRDRDKMFALRFHQIVIDAVRAGKRERNWQAFRSAYGAHAVLDAELNRGVGRYCFLTHILRYQADDQAKRFFEYETRREMVVTAIALLRYRGMRGVFPNRLEDLEPEFIAEDPVDWMNGRAVHYQRGTNGWFQLRSFGENGRDDLGGADDLPWSQTPEQRRKAGPLRSSP